ELEPFAAVARMDLEAHVGVVAAARGARGVEDHLDAVVPADPRFPGGVGGEVGDCEAERHVGARAPPARRGRRSRGARATPTHGTTRLARRGPRCTARTAGSARTKSAPRTATCADGGDSRPGARARSTSAGAPRTRARARSWRRRPLRRSGSTRAPCPGAP